jgi:hypothetical protein
MTGKLSDTAPNEAPTPWQRRTASFVEAIQSEWRSYRVAPWLFERAGRTEQVTTTVQAFGSTELWPSQWFTNQPGLGIDGMARDWGRTIARDETRAFLVELAERCAIEPARDALDEQLYEVLDQVGRGGRDNLAIFAPARWRVLQALQLERPFELRGLTGEGARRLLLGGFTGVPVFSPQQAGATDLWVVDFERIASWRYAGAFDDLSTNIDLPRGAMVPLSGVPVPATRITAEEFFAIAFDDLTAARSIRIPLETSPSVSS